MSFTVTVTTTKPSSNKFFGEFSAENMDIVQRLLAEIYNAPGFISHEFDTSVVNTRIYTSVWQTEADFNSWKNFRDLLGYQKRLNYDNDNDIISVIKTANT